MIAPPVRITDRTLLARSGLPLLVAIWTGMGLLVAPSMAEEVSAPPVATPDHSVATRLVPLYYVRDAEKVIALVRGPAASHAREGAVMHAYLDQLQTLRDQQRQLQSQRAALVAKLASQPSSSTVPKLSPASLLEATGLAPNVTSAADVDLAKIDRDLRVLSDQEQTVRAEAFRDQAEQSANESPIISEARESSLAIDRVRIAVAGESQLHLRGPLEGVNAITRMIHEIDQPMGEVKIGIHVVQFSEMEDSALDSNAVSLDRYLGHARQMSQTSQALFRAAVSNVAARYYSVDPNHFEEAFFYGPCVRNFHHLHGSHTLLSLSLLDSRDIVTTLYLAGVANLEARREIIAEFQRLVSAELPRMDAQYQESIIGNRQPRSAFASYLPLGNGKKRREEEAEKRELDLSFRQTIASLSSFSGQPNAANAIQVATTRFQRASLELRQANAAVQAMRNDRLLVAAAAARDAQRIHLQTVSTGPLDTASFGILADRVIEEQTRRVLDLQEVVRSEAAALDGQLKRLTTAFEDDLRRQFYKLVLNDLRRNAGDWNLRMGQVQTTTIRTNDRLLARVSPGQTAVLERASRPVLLQEGLQVAHGLTLEAQALAQAGSLQAAGNSVVPGGGGLLNQAGLVPVPGQHLGELVERTKRTTATVGDDISLTPIIQPDGASVAFHLLYAHTPRRDSNDKNSPASGVERHLVEANVSIPSLELQEVSRFRVTLDADEQGRGIPLLKDIPVAGTLFRPRRSAASTTQENIILVEAVIYPTAMALAGKGWLATDAAEDCSPQTTPTSTGGMLDDQEDFARWVRETLRRQARASLAEPDSQAQRALLPSSSSPIVAADR